MYTVNKYNIINFLVALIPLALILGNLFINIVVFLICVFGFLIFGKKTFIIENKNYQFLIYLFFFYLILITLINNYNNFETNELYKINIFKSLYFLRFLFLFLIINKLLSANKLNIKLFFISAVFFSFLVSLDLTIQAIFGKNILGYSISLNRPSSFFGDEHIAGGYLQKFSLFLIFFLMLKKRINYSIFFFILFLIPIILSGNRMAAIIFLSSSIIFLLMEKKIKHIIFLILSTVMVIFYILKNPPYERIDIQIKLFAKDAKEIITKAPNLFINNYNDGSIKFGSSGYIIHFNSGIQLWKQNKIFGKGLKSFPLNCKYGDNQTCNTHPHNYSIEILLDTGIVGFLIIYTIFISGILNYIKFYYLSSDYKKKFTTLPFFIIIFFEFFPIRSTGSFFTTSNAALIFLFLAIFLNFEKLKKL